MGMLVGKLVGTLVGKLEGKLVGSFVRKLVGTLEDVGIEVAVAVGVGVLGLVYILNSSIFMLILLEPEYPLFQRWWLNITAWSQK